MSGCLGPLFEGCTWSFVSFCITIFSPLSLTHPFIPLDNCAVGLGKVQIGIAAGNKDACMRPIALFERSSQWLGKRRSCSSAHVLPQGPDLWPRSRARTRQAHAKTCAIATTGV